MAYNPFSPRFIPRILSGICAVLAALAYTAWRFTDIGSAATMALDRLNRSPLVPAKPMSAFRAFISRALKHPFYVAGHFDPGRQPA